MSEIINYNAWMVQTKAAILIERNKYRATYAYVDYIRQHMLFIDLLICDEINTIYITDYYGTDYHGEYSYTYEKMNWTPALSTSVIVIEKMRPGYTVELYTAPGFMRAKKSIGVFAPWMKFRRFHRRRPVAITYNTMNSYCRLFSTIYDPRSFEYFSGGIALSEPLNLTPFWAN